MTLQELQDKVLGHLAEPLNSSIGALQTGTGSVTYTMAQMLAFYINEGYQDLARNYHPIRDDIGPFTWDAPDMFVPYSDLVCLGNSANIVRAVRSCQWGTTNTQTAANSLVSADRSATESWFRNTYPNDTGLPQWFFDDGSLVNLVLYPVYTTANSYVWGKCVVIPAPLVDPDDVPQLPTDVHKLLAFYAADIMIIRRADDQALASRGTRYRQMYLDGANELLDAAWRSDSDLANDLLKARPQTTIQQEPPQQEG